MFSLLLAIIYIAFISLGLPDSLLGSAWPIIREEFSSPISYVGIVSMIISVFTIISSLLSNKITSKLGAGRVTAISVLLTALALFGFSISKNFYTLCLLAVPYGLGAGAVDAALNNFVALKYKSRQMSWLHCFWGVGATISPYIMGWAIGSLNNWRMGYGVVSVIQIVISIILFSTLFLWKEKDAPLNNETNIKKEVGFLEVLKIKGVKSLLVAFFCYCAFETTTGIWASSYLVQYRNLTAETGARMASLFYLGITVGRFLCGFIADKVGDKNLIRIGSITVIIALILIALPIKSEFFALFGLVLAGFGGAPIYPAVIHSTPTNFGAENSQAVIGIQMASAYTGSTFSPLIFGFIARNINISLYPIFLLFFAVLLLIMTENLNYKKRMNK